MVLKIMDYANNLEEVNVPDNVVSISVVVISGDEELHCILDDNSSVAFYHSTKRYMDFLDYEYTILDKDFGIDRIEEWNKRESSYDVFFRD